MVGSVSSAVKKRKTAQSAGRKGRATVKEVSDAKGGRKLPLTETAKSVLSSARPRGKSKAAPTGRGTPRPERVTIVKEGLKQRQPKLESGLPRSSQRGAPSTALPQDGSGNSSRQKASKRRQPVVTERQAIDSSRQPRSISRYRAVETSETIAAEVTAIQNAASAGKAIHFVDHPLFAKRNGFAKLQKLKPASLSDLDILDRRATPLTDCALLPSLAQMRLLSSEEEVYLFTSMNFLRYRAEKTRQRMTNGSERTKLLESIASDIYEALRARNRIVESNLRLVISLAKKLCNSTDQLAELVSEGIVPLIRSTELFDISLGNRFSTYATWAVRNQMHRHLKRQLNVLEGRATGHDNGLEQLPDHQSRANLIEFERKQQAESLGRLLEVLSGRERLVISARFGLDGQPTGQSLAEISTRLGLSKERVRQIALKALQKLKGKLIASPGLADFLPGTTGSL
jgi:RNA polymerase primary sigma factor